MLVTSPRPRRADGRGAEACGSGVGSGREGPGGQARGPAGAVYALVDGKP